MYIKVETGWEIIEETLCGIYFKKTHTKRYRFVDNGLMVIGLKKQTISRENDVKEMVEILNKKSDKKIKYFYNEIFFLRDNNNEIHIIKTEKLVN